MSTNQVILDAFPSKAQFKPSDDIFIEVYLGSENAEGLYLKCEIYKLNELVYQKLFRLSNKSYRTIKVEKELDVGGYGVNIQLINHNQEVISDFQSAFDIQNHWSDAPRYGFLSDFSPSEKNHLKDIEFLNKHHINVVQFYDWMYRHDELVNFEENYVDPLGRTLSLEVIKQKITHAHEKGMNAMAYGAIYASLEDFYEKHKNWTLYQNDGRPYTLADIFYIMDISEDSLWTSYIINEFKKVIQLGFDGIHLDQYGYPKKAFRYKNGNRELVDLSECFSPFINRTRNELSTIDRNVGLIFNNVSNFPTNKTVNALQEVIYIEVWAPVVSYRDLKTLIDHTKAITDDKHIILAAYLAPFNEKYPEYNLEKAENGAKLTMATIFANGAYHLLIGEESKILTEGYYPNYGEMSDSFKVDIRNYYDFIVKYQQLLFSLDFIDLSLTHTGGYNEEIGRDNEIEFISDNINFSPHGEVDTVWTIIKEKSDLLVLHFINLLEIDNLEWNAMKKQPSIKKDDIKIKILIEEDFEGIYWASPDINNGMSNKLNYSKTRGTNGYMVEIELPYLDIWSLVYIKKIND